MRKRRKIKVKLGKTWLPFFFLDSKSKFFIDYLKEGKTISGKHYANSFGPFDAELIGKRPHLRKKKMFFHRGMVSAHSSAL